MNNGTNLAAVILGALTEAPSEPFLSDAERSLTRGQFLTAVAERQHQLNKLFTTTGHNILVPGGRGIQSWVDSIAVWGIGHTVVPLGIAITDSQAQYIANISDAKAILGHHPGLKEGGFSCMVIDEPSLSHVKMGIQTNITADIASIVFTSGSTGNPKGAALTHKALIGNARATRDVLNPDQSDKLFMAIPFNFISAISHFLVMAISGAKLFAIETRLLAADFFTALNKSEANCFGGSPMQMRWIGDFTQNGSLPLRWLMSSGDHLPTETISQLSKQLPNSDIFTVYGMTELAGRFCILPPEMHDQHAGAVGRPIHGLNVLVMNDDKSPADIDEVGEVYASGEYLMQSYFGTPDVTSMTLTDKGVRTGDLGYLDANGLLHLVGRADDEFKCNGEKVSALPIIQALMETGLFSDVAVCGAESPVYGTVPYAFYVLKQGNVFDKKIVVPHLRRVLPSSHIPREFKPLPAIPRTGSGKVKRADLKQLALQNL